MFTPTLILPPQGGGDEISIFLPQGRRLGWEILTFKRGNKIIILCSMGRKL